VSDLSTMLARHAALRDQAEHALWEAAQWLDLAALALTADNHLQEATELTRLSSDLIEHALDCRAIAGLARHVVA